MALNLMLHKAAAASSTLVPRPISSTLASQRIRNPVVERVCFSRSKFVTFSSLSAENLIEQVRRQSGLERDSDHDEQGYYLPFPFSIIPPNDGVFNCGCCDGRDCRSIKTVFNEQPSHKVDGFPFRIHICKHGCLSLFREYLDEYITVDCQIRYTYDFSSEGIDYEAHAEVDMDVTVSKGSSFCLHFKLTVYSDKIRFGEVVHKQPEPSSDSIWVTDDATMLSFTKYLEERGIKLSALIFLHYYMINNETTGVYCNLPNNLKRFAAEYLFMNNCVSEAEQIFFTLRHYKITIERFNNLLDGWCKNGKTQAAWDLFHILLLHSYGGVSYGGVSKCMFIPMHDDGDGTLPDVTTFNIIIDALCTQGQLVKATNLLSTMEKHECHPNVVTFNSLMHSFLQNNEPSKVVELLHKMAEKDVIPDTYTASIVTDLINKDETYRECLNFFPKFPPLHCSSKPVYAYTDQFVPELEFNDNLIRTILESVVDCGQESRLTGIQDRFPFKIAEYKQEEKSILQTKKSEDERNCEAKKSILLTREYRGEDIKVKVIIDLNSTDGQKQYQSRRCEGFQSEDDVKFVGISKGGSGICLDFEVRAFPNKITIDNISVIKQSEKAYDSVKWYACYSTLDKYLEDRGIKPSTINSYQEYLINNDNNKVYSVHSFNPLILRYYRCIYQANKLSLYLRSCRFSIKSFNGFIDELCKQGKVEIAQEIFNLLEGRQDVSTCNIMVDGLCKEGQLAKAADLLLDMKKNDCTPNVVAYNTLMRSFLQNNEMSKVAELLQEMLGRNVIPDASTASIVIDLVKKDENYHSCLDLLPSYLQRSQIDRETWSK